MASDGVMAGDNTGTGSGLKRREALALAVTAVGSVAGAFALGGPAAVAAPPLRPPGALAERDFLAACIRCFQCGSVCPNQCIQFRGIADGLAQSFTRYIEPREQTCILCMKCTEACPTDALTPIADNPQSIASQVRMGLAEVSESLCYSYNGRICGVCYYACPFPDRALRQGAGVTPIVDKDA